MVVGVEEGEVFVGVEGEGGGVVVNGVVAVGVPDPSEGCALRRRGRRGS